MPRLVSVLPLLLCSAAVAGIGVPATPAAVKGVDRAYMNLDASPEKDFYAYANGAFDNVKIPGEYAAYGVNQEIDERNEAILKEILETAAGNPGPAGSLSQRVGDFYASGMDEAAIEAHGLTPIAPVLAQITAIGGVKDLVEELGRLHAQGIEAGLSFGVKVDDKDSSAMIAAFSQGGLGLPERDYYLRPDAKSAATRKAYVEHLQRIFRLGGDDAKAATAAAAAVLVLETKLAKASRTLVALRDPEKNYNKLDRAALAKTAPGLDWELFLSTVGVPATQKTVLVGQPEFLAALATLAVKEPLETWRRYLRAHVLRHRAGALSKAFVDEAFAFEGKVLSGATELKPRWKRVLAFADEALGEDLGQLYVRTTFSAEAKARALRMVQFHKEAMRERLRIAAWMGEATKQAAYEKLDAMRTKIGYPDVWRDYSKLTISRQAFVLNVQAAEAFEVQRQLAKLGRPVDHGEWQMTPQTNNAYYDPSFNEMCFPAGILQPPFFDVKADDASNYGALASTIGHELTHGFDDEGRQYDAKGNLKDWWSAADVKGFNERAERVAKQYDAYEPLKGLHINGHQTLGENIADIGGLRVSFEAFKLATKGATPPTLDGFTPEQRFFIAFAQGWRTNQRPEAIRLAVTSNFHSPVRWRVLGPVARFPEFCAAFGCQHRDADVAPPIW